MEREISQIVHDFDKRVVPISIRNDNSTELAIIGSGILFRVGNALFVQTCYHVIRDSKFVYIKHDGIDEEIQTNYSYSCALQDKACFKISTPGNPSSYCQKDYSNLLVNIQARRKKQLGLIEYHYKKKKYALHIYADSTIRNCNDIKLTFHSDRSSQMYSTAELCYCSHTGCCVLSLEPDHVPKATKDMFKPLQFWEKHLMNPIIAIISYPGGNTKKETRGQVVIRERSGQFSRCEKNVRFKIDSMGKTILNHYVRLTNYNYNLADVIHGIEHLVYEDKEKKTYLKIKSGKRKFVEIYIETNAKVLSLEVRNNDNRRFMKFKNEKMKCFYKMNKNNNNNVKSFLADMSGKSVHESLRDVEMPTRIYYNANTECGSSGGAVLVIGEYNGEYKTLLAMHSGKVDNNSTGTGILICS